MYNESVNIQNFLASRINSTNIAKALFILEIESCLIRN